MENIDTLNQIFQEELDDPKLRITHDLSRDDLMSWDSLAHVRIVASIEDRFGFQFTLEQIEETSSVGELLDVIAAHQT